MKDKCPYCGKRLTGALIVEYAGTGERIIICHHCTRKIYGSRRSSSSSRSSTDDWILEATDPERAARDYMRRRWVA